jgi:CopG family nickel-responsive transcriptional regulator
MKEKLKRFGVSIPLSLLLKFDEYIKNKNYKNRSEAIRDLIRAEFVKESFETNKEVSGVISIVYDHHKRELVDKIVDIQHDYQDIIIASQHIHLDHDNCLEVIIARGKAQRIKDLSSRLQATKGVKHTTLSFTAVVE